ncbi:MAG: molybdopterin-dependent oxidoreductase [Anaerolineaceae bacterium]|nr:molybdopterin-dependent oxidoreductase [Anaerolineaceae bacterium]
MRKKILLSIFVLLFALSACQPAAAPEVEAPVVEPVVAEPTAVPVEPTAVPVEPTSAPIPTEEDSQDPVLELIGPEETMTFTIADLKALPVTEGMAGIKSSTGKITLPNTFTGVALQDLADLMGGLSDTMGINIVAEDGYSLSYSFDQIMNGTYIAYNPVSGDELKSHDPLTAIIAYEVNGEPLNVDMDGNLRLVIISDEPNQVTDGHWSIKWVNKVEIRPMIMDWVLTMKGAIDTEIDRASYESCVSCHPATWTDEVGQEWKGVSLWRLMGYADDAVKHEGWSYDVKLAKAGYDVKIIAADGFETTVYSDDADRNHDWVVAMLVDNAMLEEKNFPLKFVGIGLEKKQMVGGIATIELVLPKIDPSASVDDETEPEAPATPSVDLSDAQFAVIGMVETETGFTEETLRAMEVVSINAEHPKSGTADYEGVRLSELFELVGIKDGATTLVITADDGFSAEVSIAEILANPDCLLGFTETPGKFKMVMPGLASNTWVKGVVSIEVK